MDTTQLTRDFPALAYTAPARMHEPTLLKAVEILTELYEAREKTLDHVWGYSHDVTNKEHHSARALDFMVPSDKATGDWIADYIIAHAERLGLIHIIWYQRIWRGPYSTSLNPKGVWQDMADRDSPTQNHLDHPHVWFSDVPYIAQEDDLDMSTLEEMLKELRIIRQAVAPDVELPIEPEPEPEPPAPEPEPEVPPGNPVVDKVGDTLKLVSPIMGGKAVTKMQERLTAHGFATEADGWFRAGDDRAVKAFQTASGLTSDGVVGKKTWDALLAKSRLEMRSETLKILKARAWAGAPSDTQIIKDFQAAWNFGSALTVDGVPGEKTHAAALQFAKNGEKLSPNFSAAELKCRCNDRYPDCRRIFTKRSLLAALEKLRAAHYKSGLRVVSGSRCDQHNASIPGAYERSQHRYGRACDIEPRLTRSQVAALGVFSGIGYSVSNDNLVVHVDVRADAGPDRDNFPAGSKSNPNVFREG